MCASTHIQTTHMYKVSKLSSNPPAGRLSLSQEMSPFPKSWCPSLDHTFGMVCGQKHRKQWQKYFKTPNLHESVPQLTKTSPTLKLLPRLTNTRPTLKPLLQLTKTRPMLKLLSQLTAHWDKANVKALASAHQDKANVRALATAAQASTENKTDVIS